MKEKGDKSKKLNLTSASVQSGMFQFFFDGAFQVLDNSLFTQTALLKLNDRKKRLVITAVIQKPDIQIPETFKTGHSNTRNIQNPDVLD